MLPSSIFISCLFPLLVLQGFTSASDLKESSYILSVIFFTSVSICHLMGFLAAHKHSFLIEGVVSPGASAVLFHVTEPNDHKVLWLPHLCHLVLKRRICAFEIACEEDLELL